MRLTERVEWVASHVEGKDVLDVGCVGDTFLRSDIPQLHDAVRVRARSVLGIDIDREGVERLRALGHDVVCADAERFDANPRKFDVIVSGENLEHLDNPGLFLEHAWKNLRDDGQLIVTTPNARYLGVAFREMLTEYHTHIYTLKLLSRAFARYGFRIVEVAFFEGRMEYPLSLVGKLYEHVFLHFFPQLAPHFGVSAIKIIEGNL